MHYSFDFVTMGLLATELILVSLFPYQLSVVYRLVQGAVTRVHDANWMGNILVSSYSLLSYVLKPRSTLQADQL